MNTQTQEALKMAIETNEWLKSHLWVDSLAGEELDKVTNACKEALEQPAQGIELEWYNKGWTDANWEWQGLTDEERIKCYETSGHKQHIRPQDRFAVLELSIAIEQALKEKNT